MSNSVLVCARDGLPVHGVGRNGYRHSLGGRTGAIPERRRHKPVPVLRTEYDRAFGLNTPREEALELVGRFRALDQQINGDRGAAGRLPGIDESGAKVALKGGRR